MTDYAGIERALTDTLQLRRRPVAVAFRDQAPEGVTKLQSAQPSGCSVWSLASGGRVFDDHGRSTRRSGRPVTDRPGTPVRSSSRA